MFLASKVCLHSVTLATTGALQVCVFPRLFLHVFHASAEEASDVKNFQCFFLSHMLVKSFKLKQWSQPGRNSFLARNFIRSGEEFPLYI